MNEWCWW